MKAGQADYDAGGLPPTAHADLAAQFGVNKGRYFVNRGLNVDYIAMNTTRPAFSSPNMRKAANYAVDRPALVRIRGKFAGFRNDQILPPGLGGYKDQKLYPIKGSDYAKAKSPRRVELQGRHAVLGQHRHGSGSWRRCSSTTSPRSAAT